MNDFFVSKKLELEQLDSLMYVCHFRFFFPKRSNLMNNSFALFIPFIISRTENLCHYELDSSFDYEFYSVDLFSKIAVLNANIHTQRKYQTNTYQIGETCHG